MAVRFVIGRAGSGKTRRCLQHIVEALRADPMGPPIYWILPRQATSQAERRLTCASGLPGFCRVRIVSFEELSRDLVEECGGAAVPRVTALGRQLILGHLLRRHAGSFEFYASVARQPGLAGRLSSTLEELDRCGLEPAQVVQAVEKFSKDRSDADPLAAKFRDLVRLYKAYTDYLGQDRLDPRRHMDHVLGCIRQSQRLRSATVYVDEFLEFDDYQRKVLARLAVVCREMEITLLMDPRSPVLGEREPAEMSLFHRTEQGYRRLIRALRAEGATIEKPILLGRPRRFANPALGTIESSLTDPKAPAGGLFDSGIELVEAPCRRDEVEHAARRIRQLLAGGLRLRDVAVLVRSLDDYHDLIRAAFREHAIPFFDDRRRSMGHHPLVQFIRATIEIAAEDWPHDAVMLLLKTSLAGVDVAESDRLENYVIEHRLRGGGVWMQEKPWTWRRQLTRSDEQDPEPDARSSEMDALRQRLVAAVGPFVRLLAAPAGGEPPQIPLRQVVAELYAVLDRAGATKTLAQWIDAARTAGRHEQADEHEQAWMQVGELFDQLVDLLGDESVTLEDFATILESGLESFDLALAPPTVDQVLVGQVDRTRTPDVRAVLVLGMNEGVFPRIPREGTVLSDRERNLLQEGKLDIGADSRRRLLDEQLLGYIALTRASERLYVSRTLSDDAGRAMEPSPFWQRLVAIFPTVAIRTLPREQQGDPSLIGVPRQLLTALMRWARQRSAPAEDRGALPALYQWLATRGSAGDTLDSLRRRAWKALAYVNAAALSPDAAAALFPAPLCATASQVESFASCPFMHFARHALRLEPRDEADIEFVSLDHAFHDTLEDLVRELLKKNADWRQIDDAEARRLVADYARRIARTIDGEMLLGVGRNRYLLAHIERNLQRIIMAQKAVAARGEFRTASPAVTYGDHRRLPPLVVDTPAGQLRLRGRIDRVDLLEKQAAAAVIDYTLSGSPLNLAQVRHGLSLQLLAALLVVHENGQKLCGQSLSPAAAFCVRLLRKMDEVDHPEDAPQPDSEKFRLGGRQRGIFDAAHFRRIDSACAAGDSEVVSAYIRTDGEFGKKGSTDVAEDSELPDVLAMVRRLLAGLGERIMQGDIDIRPYRMGNLSPCSRCLYKSLCRFDPAINRYRHIEPMNREAVLELARQEAGHG